MKKSIEWHFNENPPEPEEEGIAYLAAILDDDDPADWAYTDQMWYDGNGHWSDDGGISRNVYAWAIWPAPPQKRAARLRC